VGGVSHLSWAAVLAVNLTVWLTFTIAAPCGRITPCQARLTIGRSTLLLPSLDREQHPNQTSPSAARPTQSSPVALRTRLTTGVPFLGRCVSLFESGRSRTTQSFDHDGIKVKPY
jgi:hypothetical protein